MMNAYEYRTLAHNSKLDADVALKRGSYDRSLELYTTARDSYIVWGDLSLMRLCMEGMNNSLLAMRRTAPLHFEEMGYRVFWEEDNGEEEEVVKKPKRKKKKSSKKKGK